MASNKKKLARLWELAFSHKFFIFFACLFSIASVIASFIPFIIIYFIVKELVINLVENTPLNEELMINYGLYAFLFAASAILFNFIALSCSHLAAFKTLYQLKYNFIKHIAYLPVGFHINHSSGQLRKIVDEDIERVEKFIAHQLPDIVGSFAAPLTILIILFIFDWRLGLATLVPIGLAYVALFSGYARNDAKDIMQEYQKRLEEMSNTSVEYVRGISVVKAFNQTFFSFKKFYESIKAYQLFCMKFTRFFENHMALFLVILNNVYLFLVPVIIYLSGYANYSTNFVLAVIFYLIFSVALPAPFLKLMYVANGMRQVVGSVERMDEILSIKPLSELSSSPNSEPTITNYDVSFDNVSFSYQSEKQEDENAITNVSFIAPQGKTTALVGLSGSGKSTTALLIPRFFDPQQGSIKIGGVDIKQVSHEHLLSLISFVFQDVFLFKQSIFDNICIGRPTATKEQVIDAAKLAQCHEFIQKLPFGYDTVIGTQGVHLSGGEKQRLAIARALLKNSPILVLDEATAFADPENEYKIQLALKQLVKNKTVIMIAHRLSTIKNAEQIVVLDKGRVVEKGSHTQLLELQNYYFRMWQFYTQALDWHIMGQSPEDSFLNIKSENQGAKNV